MFPKLENDYLQNEYKMLLLLPVGSDKNDLKKIVSLTVGLCMHMLWSNIM